MTINHLLNCTIVTNCIASNICHNIETFKIDL